jgi:hypothetical protein
MRRLLISFLAACGGLAGWPGPAGAELFSATRTVIAILADDLFTGEAEGHLDGSGTLVIRSQKNPALACFGQFTSSSKRGGSGQMHCNDGAHAKFQFQRHSIFRGYGTGNFSRGSMSFAYGFTAEEAGPYLMLPGGKKLEHNGTELALADL